ncbi:MAG: tetraacyldisaccharide 4'-kinase [Planctomycetes bacterium TMED75]|nr:tetraacyldisaccharide 4'-kinase [Planctomycetaceae bacterium]OUU96411.1 MAG: tetraacyldisaccharide 4'-kinase [Planctomycetes bacterium TMED75]
MKAEGGPLPNSLSPLSWVAARLYGLGERVSARRMANLTPIQLPVPVISIGNLTAGGTGKTPVTTRFAQAIADSGGAPGVALRGYRADETNGSDEAIEYRMRLEKIPVLVGADRAGSALSMLESSPGSFDVLLLDDGFQHRCLHRDLDIVLVDASRPALDGDLLPHGWLREPASRIQRADLVLVTNAADSKTDDVVFESVLRHRGSGPDAWARHVWSGIDVYSNGQLLHRLATSSELPLTRIGIVSGLGNPAAFESHVRREGFDVVFHRALRDHALYDSAEINRIRSLAKDCDGLLVPAKDWVKLRETELVTTENIPILVPEVSIEFTRGQDQLEQALSTACGKPIAL